MSIATAVRMSTAVVLATAFLSVTGGGAVGSAARTASPMSDSSQTVAGVVTNKPEPPCDRDRAQMLRVGASTTKANPLRLERGTTLWVAFLGAPSDAGNWARFYSWTRPHSSDPTVARFRRVTRCGHGTTVALLQAEQSGRAQLSARFVSSRKSFPTYPWKPAANIVSPRLRKPVRAPRIADKLVGGGLLVYPKRLYTDGLSARFRVPTARCAVGHGYRADIGMFGFNRRVSADRTVQETPWFAGLTIRCTNAGVLHYRAGYNHDAGLGAVHPGDFIIPGATGGDCSTPSISMRYPGGKDGDTELIPCGIVETRSRVEPTALIGAYLVGAMAWPVPVALNDVTINDQPYRPQPHEFMMQTVHRQHVALARSTPSWYRLRLDVR